MKFCFSGVFIAFMLTSCIDSFFSDADFDSKQITIQTLSLFDQYSTYQNTRLFWKGDWVFRRERLTLVDQGLREAKPDLLIMQEVMSKKENKFDADHSILKAGALYDYQWVDFKVNEFADTQEEEFLASAVSLPLRLSPKEDSHTLVKNMPHGFLGVNQVMLEDQDILVFNVKIPDNPGLEGAENPYLFLRNYISSYVTKKRSCLRRVVIGGYFGSESHDPEYQNLISELNLVDVSDHYCEKESNCYTETPINELLLLNKGDQTPRRSDRILVHKDTIIYASRRNFQEPDTIDEFNLAPYNIKQLWPTERFGWITSLRLSRCLSEL